MKLPLLSVKDLKKYYVEPPSSITEYFRREKRIVKAVDGVDLTVDREQTYGLVGESGSGKSTLGRTVIKLEEPTSGEIIFSGRDITDLNEKEMKPIRRHMQIVFQNPYSSLNPRKKIRDIILDPLRIHGFEVDEETLKELLIEVGLDPEYAHRYPHQLSGGERQRVAIARAMAFKPEFVVADEVTSSLDVSVQAQIIKLLKKLQEEFRISYLFISHDLSVVLSISDRVGVMYRGKIVEEGSIDAISESPLHPYTNILISSIPSPGREWKPIIPEEKMHEGEGCRFYSRCPMAREICLASEPELIKIAEDHVVRCFLYE